MVSASSELSLARENEALRQRCAELEAQVQRQAAALDSLDEAVIATDATGAIVHVNPAAEVLTGWPRAEALGRPAADVVQVANGPDVPTAAAVVRALEGGAPVDLADSSVLVAPDGARRPIAGRVFPLRDTKGAVIGLALAGRDASAARRIEAEHNQTLDQFRAFFDNAPIGKCITAPDGRLLRINGALAAMRAR